MGWWGRGAGALALGVLLAACGTMRGTTVPAPAPTQEGVASWYGPGFHGKRTANGEIYDQHDLTAAHPSLPLGTRVMVTSLENGRSVEVRVNDRGPFVGGRVIDLSYAAARAIDMVGPGTARVRVELLDAGGLRLASRDAAPAGLVRAAARVPSELPRASFVVQVAAFADAGRAEHLREVVSQHFPDAHVVQLETESGSYHRVRIGPYPQRGIAVARAALVNRLGYPAIVMEDDGR